MLEVRDLVRRYGTRSVFRGVSFTLAPGEFLAVMGDSGVGKSTLLNLIAGLDQADDGQVLFEGTDIGALTDTGRTLLRRQAFGFVFQAFHIVPHLSVAANVALPLQLKGEEPDGRVRAALDAVGLADRAADFPRSLSGGELQRVAIARALVHRPRLILADEPTGNLDPGTARAVLRLFRARLEDAHAACLLVTHSEMAADFADRRLVLTEAGLRTP
jgi:putative ABC transport system ATP-binding protein